MIIREGETLDSIRDVTIIQKRGGYRFSIDAVLLAEFVQRGGEKGIELGGGCGIISILLAKRFPHVRMAIVEIQRDLLELVYRNISLNGLEDRLEVIYERIENLRKLEQESFDFVVTNPPYRKKGTGRINPIAEKAIARHEILVTLEQIVEVSSHLLRDNGQFFIVHLPSRCKELFSLLTKNWINPERVRFVHSRPHGEAILVLMGGIKGGRGKLRVMEPLYLSEVPSQI